MKKPYFQALVFIVLVALVAIAGVYAGQHYFHHTHKDAPDFSLDEYFHEHLDLSPDQEKKLEAMELGYKEKLKYLEEKLKLANMELAQAIREDAKYTQRIEQAIIDNHTTMGELQKLTFKHLFEMQKVLTLEQNAQMNQEIANALFNPRP